MEDWKRGCCLQCVIEPMCIFGPCERRKKEMEVESE